jgi:hypothetical protein
MSTTSDDGRPGVTADGMDETAGLEPALAVLRRVPAVPPGAVDRVMAAAVARGHRPAGAPRRQAAWSAPGWRIAAGLVLAAGLGAAVWRERAGPELSEAVVAAAREVPPAPSVEPSAARSADLHPAAATGAAPDAPLTAGFALHRPAARRVALVGDFNGWDPAATPMARSDEGTWTATVTLAPGRHAYAYVVDGEAWVTDPRVPTTRDMDYGRDHSIMVVGAP